MSFLAVHKLHSGAQLEKNQEILKSASHVVINPAMHIPDILPYVDPGAVLLRDFTPLEFPPFSANPYWNSFAQDLLVDLDGGGATVFAKDSSGSLLYDPGTPPDRPKKWPLYLPSLELGRALGRAIGKRGESGVYLDSSFAYLPDRLEEEYLKVPFFENDTLKVQAWWNAHVRTCIHTIQTYDNEVWVNCGSDPPFSPYDPQDHFLHYCSEHNAATAAKMILESGTTGIAWFSGAAVPGIVIPGVKLLD